MLKIKKDGKTVGSFLPPNSSGNPNSEIAYFNMARILGFEDIIRPAVPYKLGKRPLSEFRRLLESDHIEANRRNRDKIRNRDNILAWIKANPAELNGAVKADKPKSNRSYNEILSNGSPKKNHALMQHVQANNPMPDATGRMALADGSATTNALETARAWSILLSLDVIFGQSDRYSGSNITVNVDEGRKTFALFSTDNGGADLCSGSKQAAKNLGLFSRYDRDAVAIIERMTTFLKGGSNGFDGYSDPKAFVVDLGFYLEPTPEKSVQCLKENCDQFLKAVRKNEELFKSSAFFPARNLVQTKPTSNEGQAADQPLGTKKAAISQELFDAIARLDTTIFEAYNGHDVDRMMVMFTEDLEFYYDTGGMSKYERTKESLKSLFAKTPDIRRDLVKSSLEIYPVKDYGAIEIGEHRFCHKENDKDDCGTFKFVMIWRKTGESWKISRVINYGHQQRSF
jgi:ketosteroid isomerase-like protein